MTFVSGFAPASPAPVRRVFVFGARGVLFHGEGLPEAVETETPVYLGRLGDTDVWAARARSAPAGLVETPLRALFFELDAVWAAIAGRGAQLLHFHETHAHCGRCGTPTEVHTREHCRVCPACSLSVWPRVSPAVIVLVRRPGEILLAKSGARPVPFYSTLAGFVEPGETLEEAVAREVHEEVGVHVANVRYFGSQPWPFPHSIMIGFTADWAGGDVRADGDEIADARWFAPDALPPLPPPISIARRLIDAWLGELAAPPR